MTKTLVFAPKTFRTRTIPLAANRALARKPSFEAAAAPLPVPPQPVPSVLPRRSPAAAASHWGRPQPIQLENV